MSIKYIIKFIRVHWKLRERKKRQLRELERQKDFFKKNASKIVSIMDMSDKVVVNPLDAHKVTSITHDR